MYDAPADKPSYPELAGHSYLLGNSWYNDILGLAIWYQISCSDIIHPHYVEDTATLVISCTVELAQRYW